MTFIGTAENLLSIITFFASSVGAILLSTDEIQFMDAPFSILDIFIAIMLFELIYWYIIRLISAKDKDYDKWGAERRDEETLSSMDEIEEYGEEDL